MKKTHLRHFSSCTMRVMAAPGRPHTVIMASLSPGWCAVSLTFIQLTVYSKRGLSEMPEELNEIVWGPIEANFQHTKGDVLEIFDW